MIPEREITNNTLTIDFLVPCGRPYSEAARKTFSCLYKNTEKSRSKVIIVGKDVSKLKSSYPTNFVWIDTNEQLWPAANRNLGAKHSKADILAFIDDDCRLKADGFLKISRLFKNKDALGVMSGKIVSEISKYMTRCFDLGAFGYQQSKVDIWNIPYLVSAFMCVRRDLFNELGGFDESIRIKEDVDFVQRILENGYMSLYKHDIKVIHDHGRYSWKSFFLYQFNNGTWPLTMEKKALHRKQFFNQYLKYRFKIALRPFHFILFPAFIIKNFLKLMHANTSILREFVKYTPGIIFGIFAYELGRSCSSFKHWKAKP